MDKLSEQYDVIRGIKFAEGTNVGSTYENITDKVTQLEAENKRVRQLIHKLFMGTLQWDEFFKALKAGGSDRILYVVTIYTFWYVLM